MNYRKLGKTDLMVSEVSFGGIPVQRVSFEEAGKVIKKSLELGINFFDTARVYTDSEEKLGKYLADVPRGEIYLATKSLLPSYEGVKKELEKSLRNLKADYIDLFQIHNISSDKKLEKVLSEDGALKALQEAQREGKIRYIGITTHKPKIVLDILRNESLSTVQFPFNIVEPETAEDILPIAKELNLGTIIMKPLCGGALRNNKAALQYILSYPVSTVIPGMQTVEEVAENTAASSEKLSENDLKMLKKEAAELGTRFCRRCEYCLPCPQGVNIPFNFLMHGYHQNYGLHEWASGIYHSQTIKASACDKCGTCEEKCPYSLPIREMMEKCQQIFEN